MDELVQKLYASHSLTKAEMARLLSDMDDQTRRQLIEMSNELRMKHYGKKVYLRGLIEFTNYCKNNCYYCGIRRDNQNVVRYRLSKDEILECCRIGYGYGFRTFVLQGGEDAYFTDDRMVEIISEIKKNYPECAITLSIGEKPYSSYKRFYDSGADRYLLRHETAGDEHYARLHPPELSLHNRKRCLYDLKEIGYQVGAGFMVTSPYQTVENIADDLLFLKELRPQMVGIGPFIPQKDTPFGNFGSGTVDLTVLLIAIIRLLLPDALIPSTTALGTVHPLGREMGLQAGANVVMPNLSPVSVRKKYLLYDNKICTGEEAAECLKCLENRIKSSGFEMDFSRGDHIDWGKKKC